MLLFIFIPFKQSIYPYISAINLKSSIVHLTQKTQFFSVYSFPNNYYYTKKDFQFFASLIHDNPQNVMVYPTDTYIPTIYGQTYNSLPVLFHNASDSEVEKLAVDKLSKSPPKYIILGIDTISAVYLDDIPNFSRNPFLAKWIINNYSIEQDRGKYLLLRYNPHKKTGSNSTLTNCNIYSIEVENTMKSNIYERIIKPSTYYLKNASESGLPNSLRLPYTGHNESILIFENYKSPDKMKSLFTNRIDFNTYHLEDKKDLTILKKLFIPKLTKTSSSIQVNCYYK